MQPKEFYKTYLLALEKAFQNDAINEGFYVKGPEEYIDSIFLEEATQYLEENEDEFLEKVAYYFDAKSHYFPSVKGVDIDVYKKELMDEILRIKKNFPDF